ncbi:MAG: accessory gene regulator B family protein [Bacilli bacterium]|nr:accessory gene regulator B family protein [Bacilli bacterium]
MKKKFLNYTLSLIKEKYPETDDIKLDEYRYSLEGFYLTISKMLFIIPMSIILNVFKEMIILLIFFNILREPGHGLHATKSWICLISSSLIFIGVPLICKTIIIPFNIKIILGIFGILLIYKYAPADTKKAPIIKKSRRDKYKFITTISCVLLAFLSLIIKDQLISNIIIFAIWIEVLLILPLTYKIFHLSYDNYKEYILNMN